MEYRVVTARDVDKFIQFPDTISVNTGPSRAGEEILLTVLQEDIILENYDKQFEINDYAIYASIGISNLFNSSMEWKYMVKNIIDETGNFTGPHILDAHDGIVENTSMTEPIINAIMAKTKLGVDANDTRFVHYRSCDRFFKYSFRVGDPVTLNNATAHVFAVYLDALSGDALPYWFSSSSGQEAEYLGLYYADLDLASHIGLTLGGMPVTVVCPPHPDFIASASGTVANNLAYTRDIDGNLMIRPLPFSTTSHTYTEDDFVPFGDSTNRELYVYMMIEPKNNNHYMGETFQPMWTSKTIDASWGPIRDILDENGNRIACPVPADVVKSADRFVFNQVITASTLISYVEGLPRMYFPTSQITTRYIPGDSTESIDVYRLPFAFDLANETEFDGDIRKSIMGGRVMQLVSTYMFDAATDKELAYFPYLLNEAKSLTDKIIENLGSSLLASRNNRNSIIEQIVIKYGRHHFDEMAVYGGPSGDNTGDMWQVLTRLAEFFVFFTVSVMTTISTGTKDNVNKVQFVQVPMVLRVHS